MAITANESAARARPFKISRIISGCIDKSITSKAGEYSCEDWGEEGKLKDVWLEMSGCWHQAPVPTTILRDWPVSRGLLRGNVFCCRINRASLIEQSGVVDDQHFETVKSSAAS
jgi:hypothetical protein